MIKDIFLTKTKNTPGVIGLTFYIKGKPWVITIDDYMLFYGTYDP